MARIFFMHIAKTAGSSANKYFIAQYPKEKAITHAEEHVTELSREFLLEHQFISGHINVNHIMRFDTPKLFDYVTFVREPVAQLISHMKWMKRQSNDAKFSRLLNSHPQVKELSQKLNDLDFNHPSVLSDFFRDLNDEEVAYFDNCQLRYFIPGLQGHRINQQHCNNAMERMMQSFKFVGISEEFDKSIAALAQIYGFAPKEESIQENVSKMDDLFDMSNPKVAGVIKLATRFDRQLYYRALQRFEQQCNNLEIY